VTLEDRIGIENVKTGGRKRITGDSIGTTEEETGITKAMVTGLVVTLGNRTETDSVEPAGRRRITGDRIGTIEGETGVTKAMVKLPVVKQEDKTGGTKKIAKKLNGKTKKTKRFV
jgi:hypothetical protein